MSAIVENATPTTSDARPYMICRFAPLFTDYPSQLLAMDDEVELRAALHIRPSWPDGPQVTQGIAGVHFDDWESPQETAGMVFKVNVPGRIRDGALFRILRGNAMHDAIDTMRREHIVAEENGSLVGRLSWHGEEALDAIKNMFKLPISSPWLFADVYTPERVPEWFADGRPNIGSYEPTEGAVRGLVRRYQDEAAEIGVALSESGLLAYFRDALGVEPPTTEA